MKKGTVISLAVIASLLVGYVAGLAYYTNRFIPRTSYASVGIGGLTVEQAQSKVAEVLNERQIQIKEAGQPVAEIRVGDITGEYALETPLKQRYYQQNPVSWFTTLVSADNGGQLTSQVELKPADLEANLADQGVTNEGREPAKNAEIVYSDQEGYYAQEGAAGNAIDYEVLSQEIMAAAQSGEQAVDLETAYQQPALTTESDEVQEGLENIDQMIHTPITLQFNGQEEQVPAELIEAALHFDENNQVTLDPEVLMPYLESLDEQYARYGMSVEFDSTLQGTITVPPGILGWSLDYDAEIAQLAADVQSQQAVTRPAKSLGGGIGFAGNGVGDTYIEIDLTYQMMYLYVDGVCIVSTDITSGQPKAETIPGANQVNEMLHQTELKGYNQFSKVEYSTPVDYWIRFDHHAQGIHDATWQSWFGGDAWITNGSLGCINTPYWAVQTIYEYVDLGTPVLVFY